MLSAIAIIGSICIQLWLLYNRVVINYVDMIQVCMVMIVITMAVRCDVTSVIYALWLGVFLVLGRQNCSIVWPVYVGFLAILLPIQYLLVLGWPPGLCLRKYCLEKLLQQLVVFVELELTLCMLSSVKQDCLGSNLLISNLNGLPLSTSTLAVVLFKYLRSWYF